MNRLPRKRSFVTLLVLVLLALAYRGWFYYQPTLLGTNELDGIIGVLLGLYICSHPAANFLDILFFGRGALFQGSSKRSDALWLSMNILVLVIGWLVIVIGTTRFFSKTA